MKKWNLKKLWTLFINYSYLFSLKSCFWTLNLQNEYLHDIIIIIVKNTNNAHFSSSKVCFDTILSGNATGDNVSALNPSQIVATVVACAQLWLCRNKMCLLGSWASPFYASVWNPSCSPPPPSRLSAAGECSIVLSAAVYCMSAAGECERRSLLLSPQTLSRFLFLQILRRLDPPPPPHPCILG